MGEKKKTFIKHLTEYSIYPKVIDISINLLKIMVDVTYPFQEIKQMEI